MKRIEAFIEYLILGVIFLVPLFYDKNIYLSFDLSKALILWVLTLFLVILVSYRIIFFPFSIKKNSLYLPIAIFFLTTFFSVIFSVSFWVSLLGTYRRFEGLITIMCYLFLFFIVSSFIPYQKVYRFLKAIVIIGVISSIFGIYESINGSYPLASFGNQNFLAAYLVLSLPFSLFFAFSKNRLWLLAFLIISICLLLTRTRGAWVAFFISMLFFLIRGRMELLKRIEVKIIGCLLLLALVFLSLNERTSPIKRVLSTFKISDGKISFQGTALERLYLWEAGIKTMLAYPLTGCGIETMRLAYGKYEPKELEVVGGHNVKADRSHNETIDMGVTRGIPGLISYIWLWIAIIILSLKIKDKLLSASFLASFIAYFVQCQFNFSMPSYTTTFWILCGLLVSQKSEEKKKIPKPKFSINRIILFSVISLISFIFIILTIPIYIADTIFKKGIHAKENGQFDDAIIYTQDALKRNPKQVYYYETLCESLFMKAQSAKNKEEQKYWVKRALNEANKALSITPTNGFFYNLRGGLYTLLYLSGEKDKRDLAMKEYNYALELMPVFIEPYLNMAIIYKKEENIKEAIRCYKKILDLNPNHPEALVNLGDIYYFQKKDIKNALIFYKKAKEAIDALLLQDPNNKKIPEILKYTEGMVSILKGE